VPAEHGRRLDNADGITPAGPDARNQDEQRSIGRCELELPASKPSAKDSDLVTQRDDLGF
jgi:hypothetical protein